MKNLMMAADEFLDGFAIIKSDGEIMYVNPVFTALTGFGREVLGRPVWELQESLLPRVYQGRFLAEQKRFWRGNFPSSFLKNKINSTNARREISFQVPSGGEKRVKIKTYTLENDSKLYVCALIKDLSDIQKYKDAFEDGGKQMSHEILSPINSLVGFTQILMGEPNLSEDFKRILNIMLKNGEKAERIARLTLVFDKLEIGTYKLIKKEVPLDKFLEDLSENLSLNQIERSHDVKIEVAPDFGALQTNGRAVLLSADLTLLQSILGNLVINAVEATEGPNRRVTMSVHVNDAITFVVHNFGSVAEEIRPRLFQKRATFGKKDGNGLGLYFSRIVAEAHGGSLNYSSNNRETYFVLQIPR